MWENLPASPTEHRETYRDPKERKKHFSRSNRQARLDIIHEGVGEEIESKSRELLRRR